MNSNSRSTASGITGQMGFFYVVSFVFILLLEIVGTTIVVQRAVSRALIPFAEQASYHVRVITAPLSSLAASYRAQTQYEALQIHHAQALAQLSELEQVRQENEALRQMIQNRHLEIAQRVVAAPIASYVQPTLSVGADQGIREGQLVSSNGVLLGKIRSVTDRQSTVELLTQPTLDQVLVELEPGAQGVIEGKGRHAVVTHLQHGTDLSPGTRITTLGQQGIPSGILVGVVGREVVDPTAPFLTVQLDQMTSFYTTPLVEIW